MSEGLRNVRILGFRPFGPHRIENLLMLSTSLLVLAVVTATLILVQSRVSKILRSSLESEAFSVAESIAAVSTQAMLTYNYGALEEAAERAAADPDINYVILHDKEGRVAGAAGTTFEDGVSNELPSYFQPLRVRQECEHGPDSLLEVAVPVKIEGSAVAWGSVRLGMRDDMVLAALTRLRIGLLLFGAVLTFLTIVASRLAAARIVAPLRRLSNATEALAWGHTSMRIRPSGATELTELSHCIQSHARPAGRESGRVSCLPGPAREAERDARGAGPRTHPGARGVRAAVPHARR